jgi:outer membrane protein assembly factor BamB
VVPRHCHWTALVAIALAAACAGSSTTTTEVTPSAGPTSAAPTRSTAPSPARSAALAAAANPTSSWPTYHRTPDRAGDAGATLPILTGGLSKLWTATLDGAVYAEPILVGSNAVVATENDSVYALSVATGHQVWRRHLGTPVPLSALPCGNIDPLGITGTPTYDPATGSVFVVTETTGAVHTLWALAVTTGAVRWHRGLDVLSNRDRHAEQQRSALVVTAGRVLTAFGGLWGDCGNYVGYVTSVPTSGQGGTTVYSVPTKREAGMWAAGGPALGPNGLVYVASGNGASTSGGYDGSDSVLALNPTTMKRVALFAPSTWASDNAQDLDLGSLAATPVAGKVVIAGKRGVAYLLTGSLGGVGGQLASRSGCTAFGGAAVRATTVFLPCTAGIRALRVGTSSLAWTWQASGIPGSPVLAGNAVYALNPSAERFYELSISTGQVLRSLSLGVAISRFATPTVANGGHTVLVPTMRGVIALV